MIIDSKRWIVIMDMKTKMKQTREQTWNEQIDKTCRQLTEFGWFFKIKCAFWQLYFIFWWMIFLLVFWLFFLWLFCSTLCAIQNECDLKRNTKWVSYDCDEEKTEICTISSQNSNDWLVLFSFIAKFRFELCV